MGLIGIAVAVLAFGAWNIYYNSRHKENWNLTEPTPVLLPEYETACGGKLKAPANYPSAMYRDRQIYFCTRACLRVFEQDTDSFMAGEVEHPIEED